MGFNIAAARKKKNMTQAELAQRACVSRATLSGLESGRIKQTTLKTLQKIANVLGVEISYFFTGET